MAEKQLAHVINPSYDMKKLRHCHPFYGRPCVADADCGTLCVLWFLFSSFFSSPNLSGRRLDVYHTIHMVWP